MTLTYTDVTGARTLLDARVRGANDRVVVTGGRADGGAPLVANDIAVTMSLDDESGSLALQGVTGSTVSWGGGVDDVPDVDPGRIGHSIARFANTGIPANDFQIDPTPTPGAANDAVVPTLVAIDRTDSVATASETSSVTIVARDLSDATQAIGVTFADQASTCAVLSKAGTDVTIQCPVPPRAAGKLRGNLVLRSAPATGIATLTVANGWTYTAVDTGFGSAQNFDFCTLGPATATIHAGAVQTFTTRAFEPNVTTPIGYSAAVTAEIGVGSQGVDPRSSRRHSSS